MTHELYDEGIASLTEIIKILYNVAQRERPEWFVAVKDNKNNPSDIDINTYNNGLNM